MKSSKACAWVVLSTVLIVSRQIPCSIFLDPHTVMVQDDVPVKDAL